MKYGNFGIPNFFSQSGKTLQQFRDEYSEWLTALRPEQAVNALMAEAMLEDEEVLLELELEYAASLKAALHCVCLHPPSLRQLLILQFLQGFLRLFQG